MRTTQDAEQRVFEERSSGPGDESGGASLAPGAPGSLIDTLNVLLRRWRLVSGIPLVACVLAVSYSVLLRRVTYTAASQFAPEMSRSGGSSASQLAGLATQLGLTIAGAGSSETLDFYAELVRSQELMRGAVLTTYRFARAPGSSDSLSGTLVDLMDIGGRTPEDRIRRTIRWLRRTMSVTTGLRSGLVTVRTTAPWPDLAVQLNRKVLELVNQFNLEKRQSQAAAERRFIEGRMQGVQAELGRAEATLEQFLLRNRSYENSPELRFQANRLQRGIDLQQQVYTSLAQSYERSRMDEVRNTPVITIVDRPEGTVLRNNRLTALIGLVTLVFAGMLSVGLAFLADHLDRQRRERPEDYGEMVTRMRAIASRVSPRRWFSRAHS